MNKENLKVYRVSIIITVVLSIITALMFFGDFKYEKPDTVYQIYLDGEKVGLIDDRNELYDLINEEQIEIKNNYIRHDAGHISDIVINLALRHDNDKDK